MISSFSFYFFDKLCFRASKNKKGNKILIKGHGRTSTRLYLLLPLLCFIGFVPYQFFSTIQYIPLLFFYFLWVCVCGGWGGLHCPPCKF